MSNAADRAEASTCRVCGGVIEDGQRDVKIDAGVETPYGRTSTGPAARVHRECLDGDETPELTDAGAGQT